MSITSWLHFHNGRLIWLASGCGATLYTHVHASALGGEYKLMMSVSLAMSRSQDHEEFGNNYADKLIQCPL